MAATSSAANEKLGDEGGQTQLGQHSTYEAYAIDEFVNSVKKHQSAHTQSEEQQTKVVVAEKVVLNFHFCLYLIK